MPENVGVPDKVPVNAAALIVGFVRVLFVNVSVVALPISVSVAEGRVTVTSPVEVGPINVSLFVPLLEFSKNSIKPELVEPFFTFSPPVPSIVTFVNPANVVDVPPNDIDVEPTVTALFDSLSFAIDPPNIAFVIPLALTRNASESISILEPSTPTARETELPSETEPPPLNPFPAVTVTALFDSLSFAIEPANCALVIVPDREDVG